MYYICPKKLISDLVTLRKFVSRQNNQSKKLKNKEKMPPNLIKFKILITHL